MQNTYLFIALGAFLLIGATTMMLMHHSPNTAAHPKRVVDEFKKWQKTHHKSFSDPDNEVYRLNVFSQNLKKIEAHPEDSTYTLGSNQFMDLTKVEFKHFYLGLLDVERPFNANIFESNEAAPANVEWRQKKPFLPLKIKDNVVHAGPSLPLVLWNQFQPLKVQV